MFYPGFEFMGIVILFNGSGMAFHNLIHLDTNDFSFFMSIELSIFGNIGMNYLSKVLKNV